MVALTLALCFYAVTCVIIPVQDGPISIKFFATPVLGIVIGVAIHLNREFKGIFGNRSTFYLYGAAVFVGLAAVMYLLNFSDELVSSVSLALLIILVAVSVDIKRSHNHT